jgi:hypothetical protein
LVAAPDLSTTRLNIAAATNTTTASSPSCPTSLSP